MDEQYYQRRQSKLRSDYMDSGGGGGGGSGRRYDENYYHKDERSSGRYNSHYNDNEDSYYEDSSRSRHRSRSRSPNSNRSRSTRSRNDDGGGGGYDRGNNNGHLQPTRTILIRQLPTRMNDEDLVTELNSIGMSYKQVRLVKSRETGLNRGFAFVEFNSVDEAKYWIDSSRGYLTFPNFNNARVQICFSHSNEDPFKTTDSTGAATTEWHCAKCGIKNFKKRDKCFKCGLTREESDRRISGEAYDYCGHTPCNTLVLRGLDALTTNDSIKEALGKLSNYTVEVRNCHIAKDILTNVSSGFAFVEFGSIQESSAILQLAQPFVELDGKQITLSYSKNNFQTAKTQLENFSRTAFEQVDTSIRPPRNDSSTSAAFSRSHNQPKQQTNQTSQVNSAAAVAQAAIQSMAKKQELITQLTNNMKQQQSQSSTEKMKAPDPSQFTYDETSGYYYDYSTGLYYDPTTYYYYNSTTQQYLYWDPVSSNYIPVASTPATTATAATTTTTATAAVTSPEIEKNVQPSEEQTATKTTTAAAKPAAKNAVQIAKEMEKWAQQMNKKKETVAAAAATKKPEPQKTPYKPEPFISTLKSGSDTQSSDVFKKSLEPSPANNNNYKKQLNETANSNNSSTNKPNTSPSGDKSPIDTPPHLIDENKLTCLLCKRKFDSLDILNKHVAKSDLHKKNLEALKQQQQQSKKRESSPDPSSLSSSLNKRPC